MRTGPLAASFTLLALGPSRGSDQDSAGHREVSPATGCPQNQEDKEKWQVAALQRHHAAVTTADQAVTTPSPATSVVLGLRFRL